MILKLNSASNSKQAVRAWNLLLGLGCYQTFTSNTKKAVKAFQKSKGLKEDGIAGPATLTAFANTLPDVLYGDYSGSIYVMAVQALVSSSIDGRYGKNTRANVLAFQATAGLEQTGNVKRNDWLALWDLPYTKTGKATTPKATTPKATSGTNTVQPVDYKQGDKRWGKVVYTACGNKNQTIANSGCGPTSMADIMATWINTKITPVEMCRYAVEHGFRTKSSGTAWGFFKSIAKTYGFTGFVQTKSMATVKAAIKEGAFVVASMGPGYWTKSGHYICLWKCDDVYMYANDPASNVRKKQKIAAFTSQRKQFFCFYPQNRPFDSASWTGDDEIKVDPVDPNVPEVEVDLPMERGEKICDISKYQPTINYDAFIEDTALIILRAGYRGTGGSVKEDQKFQLHANNLTERGVRFGVYFYSIATDEEKAKEEARMFWQYAKGYKPLFWAMDAEKNTITNAAIVAFEEELRRLGAEKVGCYCANHLYQKFDYGSIRDKFDFTWIPRYGSTPPVYPCDMWQYTSTGKVNGISGDVDLNKITGQGHDLKWFCE